MQVRPEDSPVQWPKLVICIMKTPPHYGCILTLPTFVCLVS